MTLKVSLVFESIAARDALVGRLKPTPDATISAHVGGARSLAQLILREKPDVVVQEVSTVDDDAFKHIEEAAIRNPGVMVLLASEDGSLATLKRAMRAGVRDVLPGPLNVASVVVALDYLRDARSINSRAAASHGSLYAFMPAKGGCGNTFVVTNLAHMLARGGKRVLVMDLNLYFGDAAMYLTDRKIETSVVDLARQSRRLDASLLEVSVLKVRDNLYLLAAPLLPYQLEEVTPEALTAIIDLARAEYDFVFLDLDRTLDPATVKALDLAERIHLVVGQTLPALQDARRVLDVFGGLGYPREKLQLVLNRYSKSSQIPVGEVERATNHRVARLLPASDEAVTMSINQGVPLATLAARDPVVRALQDWANELSPVTVQAGKQSWFSTLTGGL